MVYKLLGVCKLPLDTLLYGDTKLSYQQNIEIFQKVQDYIILFLDLYLCCKMSYFKVSGVFRSRFVDIY